MTLRSVPNNIRKITAKDDDFCIISGYAYYPRAVIEISQNCPQDFKSIILTAISKGWVSAEAYVRDSEYMWEKLSDNAS